MTDSKVKRQLVVVLGMHRSGTSAVARALHVVGFGLGERLLPAQEDNPRGFWEDADLVADNDRLLALIGERWDSVVPAIATPVLDAVTPRDREHATKLLAEKTSASKRLGLKDPRMSRLLPFWQEIFDRIGLSVRYVIVVRHPLSVAASLASRDDMPVAQSMLLWLLHTLEAVNVTRAQKRVVVDFDRLLDAPQAQVTRIAQVLGLADQLNAAELESYSRDFLSNTLRHTHFTPTDSTGDNILPSVLQLYELLNRVAADELSLDQDECLQVLADVDRELRALDPALQLSAQFARQVRERDGLLVEQAEGLQASAGVAAALRESLVLARAERDSLLQSLSWRMTAPLRQAARAVSSLSKRMRGSSVGRKP